MMHAVPRRRRTASERRAAAHRRAGRRGPAPQRRSTTATGDSPLPDADYDALKDELAALVAEHPELEPADSPLGKVNAPVAADRARRSATRARCCRSPRRRPRSRCARSAPASPARRFRVSEKLDGLSLSVVYADGALDYVATRGTGSRRRARHRQGRATSSPSCRTRSTSTGASRCAARR